MDDTRPVSAAQATPEPWPAVWRRRPASAFLATGLGVGFLPGAPGTWGSLLGLGIAESLHRWAGLSALGLLAAGVAVVGVVTSGRVAAVRREGDPGEVVIDEVAGQALALWVVHLARSWKLPAGPAWSGVALSFVLFRLLDIFKPGPIARLERLPGGLGVMADDLLAGLVAGLLTVLTLGALAALRLV